MTSELRIPETELARSKGGRRIEMGQAIGLSHFQPCGEKQEIEVALLTGGADKPYAFGLGTELISKGIALDIVGSDDLDCPEFRGKPAVNFLNLRGEQRPDASFGRKALRVLAYYYRLIGYAFLAKPKLFHILWNNKFEFFDRTLLMLYYKLLGKKIVLTVHNVNMGIRDSKDSVLNRCTLRVQYRLADHIFVHSEGMKCELIKDFGVANSRVSVIPFGINNAVPNTRLTRREARQRLDVAEGKKTLLFFGNIAPYKGLEYLVTALQKFVARRSDYLLIIAGRPKNCPQYWAQIRQAIHADVQQGSVQLREEFIPDEETEVYFKAADVVVLPYRHIYQSGILFLGYSFGLPALAADVGTLKDEIVEGKTGFTFKPEDPVDLATAVERYFESDLFKNLDGLRKEIRDYAADLHSWDTVGRITMSVYTSLLQLPSPTGVPEKSNTVLL
jgi:D-inositol-3-phosphate glycosyltransferase